MSAVENEISSKTSTTTSKLHDFVTQTYSIIVTEQQLLPLTQIALYQFTLANMVHFNPAKDIPKLDGKVMLVTGGESSLTTAIKNIRY